MYIITMNYIKKLKKIAERIDLEGTGTKKKRFNVKDFLIRAGELKKTFKDEDIYRQQYDSVTQSCNI